MSNGGSSCSTDRLTRSQTRVRFMLMPMVILVQESLGAATRTALQAKESILTILLESKYRRLNQHINTSRSRTTTRAGIALAANAWSGTGIPVFALFQLSVPIPSLR